MEEGKDDHDDHRDDTGSGNDNHDNDNDHDNRHDDVPICGSVGHTIGWTVTTFVFSTRPFVVFYY